jgi:hypothetical protein
MEDMEISIPNNETPVIISTPLAEDPYNSEHINEIALALSKAQGEYLPVAQSRQNPFFKSQYADLDAYITAARPALTKHGLAFYQFTKLSPNGPTVLHTRLIHASGQWIESRSRIIPIKNDMQAYGSALSYQRRYSAMTLLGITSNNDPLDDDGEATIQMRK